MAQREIELKQIAAQCKVIVHLCKALAEVHADYAIMFDAGGKGPENIAELVGERTARLMEDLGDILNGMDAVTEDDDWTDPIFAEAQRLWPATPPTA
jgi:hypothetical protein